MHNMETAYKYVLPNLRTHILGNLNGKFLQKVFAVFVYITKHADNFLPNKMIPMITNPATVKIELLPNVKLSKILASPWLKSGTVSNCGSSSQSGFSPDMPLVVSELM